MLKLIMKQHVSPLSIPQAIRALSYNIRMAPCSADENTENAWLYRLPKINMILNQYEPDIIGVQELSQYQVETFQKSSYNIPYVFLHKYPTRPPLELGLGIFYNSQKLIPISQLFCTWLNELNSPNDAPAWDASPYERFVIYAKFKNLINNNTFWFMTTHFDHLGIKARQESAKIVMNCALNLDSPVVLTGDFNTFPQQGGTDLYQLLCHYSNKMKDSHNMTSNIFGVPGSWIGWDYDFYKQKNGYAQYDYIFINSDIIVLQQGIIDDRVWDSQFNKELYPSDHRPVLSDILIPPIT